jgi:8-oxo-dGTP pyrophosphatase MutT (NUDIX family)
MKISHFETSPFGNTMGRLHMCCEKKQPVYCANCGGVGHMYKNCNHPITSYGVICCRFVRDNEGMITPQYLMVQRKDSLSYVEFIRGKYSIEKRAYIMKLVSNMTATERGAICSKPFEELWLDLWQADECKAYQREYNEARNKFDLIRRGYIIKNEKSEIYLNMDYIINNTVSTLDEAEWGFPKGRRNINEHDFACAIREFKEETGINPKSIRVLRSQKPFEEVFSGSNKIRYKHIYYLALSGANTTSHASHASHAVHSLFNPNNKVQSREIKDVMWLTYDEAQMRIRWYNVERKELFRRVHQVMIKNFLSTYINNRYG